MLFIPGEGERPKSKEMILKVRCLPASNSLHFFQQCSKYIYPKSCLSYYWGLKPEGRKELEKNAAVRNTVKATKFCQNFHKINQSKKFSPLPWAQHEPWRLRRLSWVSECRGQGLDLEERWVQRLRWCLEQRVSNYAQLQYPEHCVNLEQTTSFIRTYTVLPQASAGVMNSKLLSLTSNIDSSGQRDVCLSNSTEQSAVVEQPSYPIIHHYLPQILVVQDIRVDERT